MWFYFLCACMCECVSVFQLDKLEMSVSVRFSTNSNFIEDKYVVCSYLSPDQTCLLFLGQPLLNWPRYYIWAVTAAPIIMIFFFFFKDRFWSSFLCHLPYFSFPFSEPRFGLQCFYTWRVGVVSEFRWTSCWLAYTFVSGSVASTACSSPRPKRGVGVKGATGETKSFSALTDWQEVSISSASRSTSVYWFLSFFFFF